MDPVTNTLKKETYIKCKKCGDEVYFNTQKKMIPCTCGAIEVDGCEDYVRVVGVEGTYEEVKK